MSAYPTEEASSYDQTSFEHALDKVNTLILERTRRIAHLPVSTTKHDVERALQSLPSILPDHGQGLDATTTHLIETISPALMPGQAGPRCFGLVIGGVTPAAQIADHLVTSFDPCVQEHTISVALENLTLSYLLSLLSLPRSMFTQNTLTTGATASNVLGLGLGRDFVVSRLKSLQGFDHWSVPEDGFGGIDVDVFVADAHASVKKATAIVGIGRSNVVELAHPTHAAHFDLEELERRLSENERIGKGSIVCTSFGEVNTGIIASDTPAVRLLCDRYSAWLHCDAAFGAFAVLHPDFEPYTEHLALADSITSDAHKWLNVPYDCGLFFSRTRTVPRPSSAASTLCPPAPFSSIAPSPSEEVQTRSTGKEDSPSVETSLFNLTGPGKTVAAYLSSTSTSTSTSTSSPSLPSTFSSSSSSNSLPRSTLVGEPGVSSTPLVDESRGLPSPLFMNLENSRRFRALPLYASLLSLGKQGYASLVRRNVSFARQVEAYLRVHPCYDVLNPQSASSSSSSTSTSKGSDHAARRVEEEHSRLDDDDDDDDNDPTVSPSSQPLLNVVLFAPSSLSPSRYRVPNPPSNPDPLSTLISALNATRRVFVTGTKWRGRGAVRIAVSNWSTDSARDLEIVKDVLDRVMRLDDEREEE
ncbi:hypothetical protein JCM10212_000195 [Sporobolomyces blumeae]